MTKDGYHHGDLRNALIQAGLEMLTEADVSALSLRAIAARAGVSHAAPKNHFGSLTGLLTAIAAVGFKKHRAAMREGLSENATRHERCAAAMRGYIRFARENPHLYRLMFTSALLDPSDPEFCAAGAASYAVLADIATDLDWDKADTPHAQKKAELMLWSLVHGYAHLALNGEHRVEIDGVVPDIADVMPVFGYRKPK